MRYFIYDALLEPGEEAGWVVSFPDVPEAITQGRDRADALAMAEEALGIALLTYPERGLHLPTRKRRKGLVPVGIAPDIAAKLAVMEAFHESGISKSEFARRLGVDEKEARRILDRKHATKLPALAGALRVLGRRLVLGIEKAA